MTRPSIRLVRSRMSSSRQCQCRGLVRRTLACAFAIMLLLLPASVRATSAGPDAGGYTATDAAVFSFIDIAGAAGAASVLTGTDDGVVALTLPFPLTFYGQAYTIVCVSSNGAIYLVADAAACQGISDFANTDLATTAPPTDPPAILPFWSDLSFEGAGAGSVYYQTSGAEGSRKFIVQWHDAIPVGSAAPVTFQVVIAENSRRIVFQYKTVDIGDDPASKGGAATIGIRNALALMNDEQLPWSFSVPVIEDESVILFDVGTTQTPVLTWAAPAPIVYGTALGASQLNASADVAGTFAYTPPTGTVLPAGNGQVLSVLFTPSDTGRYTTATKTVDINVNQAPLVVTPADATKVLGNTFSAFTGTLVTVVNSDPITASYTSAGAAAAANVGSYQITAQLSDPSSRLGNYAVTLRTGTLRVIYNPTVGHVFLSPLGQGPSVFRAGSVLPVKFQLYKADGVTTVSTAAAKLQVEQVSACSSTTNLARTGGTFRYDTATQQYVANLTLGRNWCGTFQVKALLDDGSEIVEVIAVR